MSSASSRVLESALRAWLWQVGTRAWCEICVCSDVTTRFFFDDLPPRRVDARARDSSASANRNLTWYALSLAATCTMVVLRRCRYRRNDSFDAATFAMRMACHAPSPALLGRRAPVASRARTSASRTIPCVAPGRLGRVVARSSASRGSLSTRARGPARPRARTATPRISAIGKLFGGGGSDDDSQANVFAAKKRSAVRIPGLVVHVTPAEVADENAVEAFEDVMRRGATAVILSDAEDAASTRALFDAGLALKERLRGRAALFVADRTDIAASVEADGVVLGDDGVPVVVARRSMPGPAVVARAVGDEKAALVAAKEGADLVFVRGSGSGSSEGSTRPSKHRLRGGFQDLRSSLRAARRRGGSTVSATPAPSTRSSPPARGASRSRPRT